MNKVSKDQNYYLFDFIEWEKNNPVDKNTNFKKATPGYIVTFREVLTKCVLFVSWNSVNCQDERRSGRSTLQIAIRKLSFVSSE